MGAPDLAAGDLFGACLVNMFSLGLIDLMHRHKSVWQQAAFEHALTASLAMVLTAVAACFVLLREGTQLAGMGLGSFVLLVLYLSGMRLVYRQQDLKRRHREAEVVTEYAKGDSALPTPVSRRTALQRAGLGFGLAGGALVVAAPLLARSAQAIAEQSGISTTFIGTSMVAVVTGLPELVTAWSAVRLGAFDLAVGNLFGSNAFNMAAFAFADMAYREGALLSAISPTHAATGLWAILMMNIGLMGIIYRVEHRYFLIEPDSAVMIIGYFLGLWLLFR
jgi:cation:H+ antiporter